MVFPIGHHTTAVSWTRSAQHGIRSEHVANTVRCVHGPHLETCTKSVQVQRTPWVSLAGARGSASVRHLGCVLGRNNRLLGGGQNAGAPPSCPGPTSSGLPLRPVGPGSPPIQGQPGRPRPSPVLLGAGILGVHTWRLSCGWQYFRICGGLHRSQASSSLGRHLGLSSGESLWGHRSQGHGHLTFGPCVSSSETCTQAGSMFMFCLPLSEKLEEVRFPRSPSPRGHKVPEVTGSQSPHQASGPSDFPTATG